LGAGAPSPAPANPSPRPVSRAEAQRNVSRRLHRGVPPISSADPLRREPTRMSTSYPTMMNGMGSGPIRPETALKDRDPDITARSSSSRYLKK